MMPRPSITKHCAFHITGEHVMEHAPQNRAMDKTVFHDNSTYELLRVATSLAPHTRVHALDDRGEIPSQYHTYIRNT